MAKTLKLSEVKIRLSELVVGVQEREEEVVVTRNGRPAAMLINADEYTRLKETVDALSDPALMSQIAESWAFYKRKGKGLSFEDAFGEPLASVKKRPRFFRTQAHSRLRIPTIRTKNHEK